MRPTGLLESRARDHDMIEISTNAPIYKHGNIYFPLRLRNESLNCKKKKKNLKHVYKCYQWAPKRLLKAARGFSGQKKWVPRKVTKKTA